MASMRDALPRPSNAATDLRSDEPDKRLALGTSTPRYGARSGFLPRTAVSFADGGAFPEIHIAQYPPGLGLVSFDVADAKPKAGVATVTVTANGDASYDSIIGTNKHKDQVIASKHADVMPKPNNVFERPSEADTQTALAKTKEAILGKVEKKAMVAQTKAGAYTRSQFHSTRAFFAPHNPT